MNAGIIPLLTVILTYSGQLHWWGMAISSQRVFSVWPPDDQK